MRERSIMRHSLEHHAVPIEVPTLGNAKTHVTHECTGRQAVRRAGGRWVGIDVDVDMRDMSMTKLKIR